MSYSYDPGLSTLKDSIRYAIADTQKNSTQYWVEDETINAKLAQYDYLEALAQIAEGMRVAIAMSPDSYDEGSGGLKAEWKFRDGALAKIIESARSGLMSAPGDEPDRPGAVCGRITTYIPEFEDVGRDCREWPSGRLPW